MNLSFQPWKQEIEDSVLMEDQWHHLIIWNDDVNTFDWVIESLMEICGHTQEQAEQCALLIHFQGKYAVKKGAFDTLKPFCEQLINRSINATIDF